jgi:hypothetical protein
LVTFEPEGGVNRYPDGSAPKLTSANFALTAGVVEPRANRAAQLQPLLAST